jgi:hypothetical protein
MYHPLFDIVDLHMVFGAGVWHFDQMLLEEAA